MLFYGGDGGDLLRGIGIIVNEITIINNIISIISHPFFFIGEVLRILNITF